MSVENSGTWESKDDISVEIESHTLRRHTQTHRERLTHVVGKGHRHTQRETYTHMW